MPIRLNLLADRYRRDRTEIVPGRFREAPDGREAGPLERIGEPRGRPSRWASVSSPTRVGTSG